MGNNSSTPAHSRKGRNKLAPKRGPLQRSQIVPLDTIVRKEGREMVLRHVRNNDFFTQTRYERKAADQVITTVKKKGYQTRARKTGPTKQLVRLSRRK